MDLGTRTIIGAGWHLSSIALQALLQLAVLALIARYVLPSEFGLLAIANIAVGLFSMLSQGGIGPALVQRSSLNDDHVRAAFLLSLCLAVFAVLIVWLMAPSLARYFGEEDARNVLRVASFSLLLLGLGTVAESLLERELSFDKLTWVNLGSYVFGYAPVAVVMAVQGFGVWSLVAGGLAHQFLRAFALMSVRPHALGLWIPRRESAELMRFGGGITLVRIFTFVAQQADNVIIGRRIGAAALGAYRMAFTGADLQRRYLGSALDRVIFPAMSEIQSQSQRLARVYLRAVSASALMMVPTGALVIITAPELVPLLLGPRWEEVVLPLQILVLQAPLRASIRVTDALLAAMGVVYRVALYRALYAATVIVCCWVGSHWGLVGVAVGGTAAVTVNFGTMIQLGLRRTRRSWLAFARALIPGIMLGAIVAAFGGGVALLLRPTGASPLVTMAAAILAGSVAAGGAALAFPRIIGPAGSWLMREVTRTTGWGGWIVTRLQRGG